MNTPTRKAQHIAWQLTKDTLDLALYALVATEGHLPRYGLEGKLSTHMNAIGDSVKRLRQSGKIITVRTSKATTLYTHTYATLHGIVNIERTPRHLDTPTPDPEDIECLELYTKLNALWPCIHTQKLKAA